GDLLLLRPPDQPPRPARPAARAGHHRPQHRQRLDGGLLAPGGRHGRLGAAADPRRRHPVRRRRAPRVRRRRPGLPPGARPVPRPAVPRAGHAPGRRVDQGRAAGPRRDRARRARRQRDLQAARVLLERLVGRRQLAQRHRRPRGADRAVQDARLVLRDGGRADVDGRQPGGRRLRRDRRAGRRDPVDRHRAGGAQRNDQELRERRRGAQRPDGPPRRAARPPVRLRPGLDHRRRQRLAARDVRRRRRSAGRRHGGQLAAGADLSRRQARRAEGDLGPRRDHRLLPRPAQRHRADPRRRRQRRARQRRWRPLLHLCRRQRVGQPDRGGHGGDAAHDGHRSRRRQRDGAADGRAARRQRRQRLPRLRGARRHRGARGGSPGGQRQGAPRCRRRPPPEHLRRGARRGDDQPRALPARLPGVLAGDVDARRDARRADQPDRTSGAV
ncbi:MAG: Flagellar hook-associated protein FlgK, partial [uncultured Solirubrobacteraceae bacterium]